MVWITTTRTNSNGDPVPRRRDLPELEKAVEFSDTGSANVSDADAAFLVDEFDYIEYKNASEDEDEDDNLEADDDASGDTDTDSDSDAATDAESTADDEGDDE